LFFYCEPRLRCIKLKKGGRAGKRGRGGKGKNVGGGEKG